MPELTETYNHSDAENGNGAKKKSRRRGVTIVIIVVVVAAIAVFAYVRFVLTGSQSTDDAAVDGNQVVVSAETLDQITTMTVAEGDHVSKNQVIVTLDDTTLKAEENQAKVEEVLAAGNVTLAQVKLNQAKTDFDRASVQYQSKIIPQEQYDHLSQAYAAAQASYNISLAQEKQAAAQLETVETNLAHTIIASTIDGVVAKKWTMPGDVVQPAQPIYTLYDLANLWVTANFKETQILGMRVNDPVSITVDAFPDTKYTGKVESIGAATASEFSLIPPDNATGNYTKVTQRVPVKITIDNLAALQSSGAERLLPGMSVEVRVATGAGTP